jgi:AmmeMemoRadiSam system protein B
MKRFPAVSGMFYPGNKNELLKMINDFLKGLKEKNIKNINGLIVPHAGYIYSGKTAAYAYNLIKNKKIEKIIILCPNHTTYLNGCCLDDFDSWLTSLGEIKVDFKLRKDLLSKGLFFSNNLPHLSEHAIEVQLPFLQQVLKNDFEILPIIVGEISNEEAKKIANIINELKAFIIISTDLSHYNNLIKAEKIDKNTIKIIENLDIKKFNELDACGKYPLLIALNLMMLNKWKPKLLYYDTSATASKDKEKVVGYASFAF